MKTTEYYGSRKINYKMSGGLGYTVLTIFTTGGDFERYERNDKTGYCKNYFTGKRISIKTFNELEKTCKQAF